MICRAHPPESRRFQHLDEQRGWALLRSYPRNPSPPPDSPPQQTHLIDFVCTSFMDNICTASQITPPSPHPLKLCRTPPPTSAWWNLHTNMVWQPNYMLILHTWYILAGKKTTTTKKTTSTWKVTLQINFSTWCPDFSYVSFLLVFYLEMLTTTLTLSSSLCQVRCRWRPPQTANA